MKTGLNYSLENLLYGKNVSFTRMWAGWYRTPGTDKGRVASIIYTCRKLFFLFSHIEFLNISNAL